MICLISLLSLILATHTHAYSTYTFNTQLGFIFPTGQAKLPQKVDITYFMSGYWYETATFHNHLTAFDLYTDMIRNGSIFKINNTNAVPIPQLGQSASSLMQQIRGAISKINQITGDNFTYGQQPTGRMDVFSITRKFWFPNTVLDDIKALAAQVDKDKNYALEGPLISDQKAIIISNHVIMFVTEITKYHKQIHQLAELLTNLRNRQLSEESTRILKSNMHGVTEDYETKLRPTYYLSQNNSIIFQIQSRAYKDLQSVVAYKSIPYLGHKLEGDFYSDTSGNKVFRVDCRDDLCFQKDPDSCGEAIYENDLMSILVNCTFVPDDSEFDVTPIGIFIYKSPSEELQAVLANHSLQASKVPMLAQFSGCFNLTQEHLVIESCLNLTSSQIKPKYDTDKVDKFFNPFFLVRIFKYIQNGPILTTLLVLPTALILVLCLFKAACNKMCCSKPKYERVPNYETPSRRNRRRSSKQRGTQL